jgi:hypothetical protein
MSLPDAALAALPVHVCRGGAITVLVDIGERSQPRACWVGPVDQEYLSRRVYPRPTEFLCVLDRPVLTLSAW